MPRTASRVLILLAAVAALLTSAVAPVRAATTTYSGGLLFRLPYPGQSGREDPAAGSRYRR
ncbi:hypothetical protein [Actinocatenispora sera]|uniref:hypothetical protein n=1 Tax=Actinocatenispora sera TaxID=390989 RepID=UPI0012EDB3FB|nr:hypothetical protein [Actinocatenispora sera]